MGALCTVADVEALVGAPIPPDASARVDRLIELASGIVTDACRPLPTDVVPEVVVTTTATLVARQYLNPSMATQEMLGGYRAGYGTVGMALSDADKAMLGDWATWAVGQRAYSVMTPSPYAVDPVTYPYGAWWGWWDDSGGLWP